MSWFTPSPLISHSRPIWVFWRTSNPLRLSRWCWEYPIEQIKMILKYLNNKFKTLFKVRKPQKDCYKLISIMKWLNASKLTERGNQNNRVQLLNYLSSHRPLLSHPQCKNHTPSAGVYNSHSSSSPTASRGLNDKFSGNQFSVFSAGAPKYMYFFPLKYYVTRSHHNRWKGIT